MSEQLSQERTGEPMDSDLMITWRVPYVWGEGERLQPTDLFPDGIPDSVAERRSRLDLRWRDSTADVEDAWLWMCQVRQAPYSYDLLDNRGRRSPRTPDPAMTNLELGQKVMGIFEITGFEPGRWFDLVPSSSYMKRLMPHLRVRYCVIPTPTGSRLAVAAWTNQEKPARIPQFLTWLPTMGDLIMMRKQLITLAKLAEETTSEPGHPAKGPGPVA